MRFLKAFLLALSLVMGLAVLGVGAVALAFQQGWLRPPELRGIRLEWGKITPESSEVVAHLQIHNPLPVGLSLGNLEVEARLSLYDTPGARLLLSNLHLPRGDSTLTARAYLLQSSLPQWWPLYIRNGETLQLTLTSRIGGRVLGRSFERNLPRLEANLSLPLLEGMESRHPTTLGLDLSNPMGLLRNPTAYLRVSPPDPTPDLPILTLESWRLTWGEATSEYTEMVAVLTLRNETALPLPIPLLRMRLEANGIPVIPEADLEPEPDLLPPGQAVPVRVRAQVDPRRLAEWWTSHLRQGEQTDLTARLGLKVRLPALLPLAGLSTEGLDLPLVPLVGLSCRVETDILGAATYEANRALGTPTPEPAPQPVQVRCG